MVAFDAAAGEAALVERLSEDVPGLWPPVAPPAPADVVAGGTRRALEACEGVDAAAAAAAAAAAGVDALDDAAAKALLARALARLAGLDAAMLTPRSALSGKAADRTLRVSGDALAPGAVVKALKGLGAGKLGRVTVSDGGAAALVDVPAKRADRVLAAVADEGLPAGWGLEVVG